MEGLKNFLLVLGEQGKYVRDAFQVSFILTIHCDDAKCDPTGRLFGGTLRTSECNCLFILPNASFYRYDRETNTTKFYSRFYYIYSCSYVVQEFDHNFNTGRICKQHNNNAENNCHF